ncbi:TadE/TadG family type IV pilus assembly protein [Phycicoccus flavus]|uniref:Putative Flp pilus-assembly TadG-like N-terminal domain-containing protein n=1 Tax=Phycicoccus flavus TaxID=2502783 RepID=A0A8T6R3W9_9MICO|nr:Tad domain-containing protein [Phycicoccus flavus]NHA69169.1 hypothetical protein [Phycicoccus flavus]
MMRARGQQRDRRGRRRSERGAAAALVVVILAAGVMFGAAALAVDVGNIMLDRRQQQNGADAGAYRLAQLCGKDATLCTTSNATAPVTTAIQGNFSGLTADHSGQIKKICGRVPGATIPTCTSATTDADLKYLGECPPLPSKYKSNPKLKYVEVYSKTLNNATGTDKLRGFFSQQATSTDACARYGWGPAKKTGVLPLTFGACEWARAVGATYNTVTKTFDTSAAVWGKEVALGVNYDTKNATCANFNGHDYAGGFGWLDHPTGVCEVSADKNAWVPGWPGNGTGNDCLPKLNVGVEIFIPIYDCINDSKTFCPNDTVSSKTNYHIAGMAAFVVTAVDLTGKTIGTPGADAKNDCQFQTNNKQCIYGKFVKDLVGVGEIDTDPNASDFGYSVTEAAG